MKILLIDGNSSLIDPDKIGQRKESLVVETVNSPKEGLKRIDKNNYDVIISEYENENTDGIELFNKIGGMGKKTPILLLDGSCENQEEKRNLLKEIFKNHEILSDPKIAKKYAPNNEVEILSKKESLKSAFTEVWKFKDYVLKIKGGGIKEAERRRKYQIELRQQLDFLPKYYGMLITKSNGKEIVVNFYEFIKPLKASEIKLDDLKKILELVEKSYTKGYHGIDLKHSNFGKKNGQIYYLDEEGIGQYVPQDWIESLKKFLNKINSKNS